MLSGTRGDRISLASWPRILRSNFQGFIIAAHAALSSPSSSRHRLLQPRFRCYRLDSAASGKGQASFKPVGLTRTSPFSQASDNGNGTGRLFYSTLRLLAGLPDSVLDGLGIACPGCRRYRYRLPAVLHGIDLQLSKWAWVLGVLSPNRLSAGVKLS